MAGKPEAVFLDPEIVSKKGKFPSREVNETNSKVTKLKSSKVTEKPKAKRKPKGRYEEQDKLRLVRDIEGDIDSLIQQATSLQEPSLGEENEILGAIVQEYDLEDFWSTQLKDVERASGIAVVETELDVLLEEILVKEKRS
ncbi:hypothetical protein P5673_023162 [Acropora cervicornis]|uniref:Uncharacterized protein n=1 Tax=Acropora cervicornis TaxID=6130 RepID=A0AAD9UZE0_ACRCE|nr:hypothetical protein P5673_023162 [Acropora cervicornis]